MPFVLDASHRCALGFLVDAKQGQAEPRPHVGKIERAPNEHAKPLLDGGPTVGFCGEPVDVHDEVRRVEGMSIQVEQ